MGQTLSSGNIFICKSFQRGLANARLADMTVQRLPMEKILNDDIVAIAKAFKNGGFDLRLVGGVVRDFLLEKSPNDIDMATDASPEEIAQVLNEAGIVHKPTGLRHGTLTAVLDSKRYEITSLRVGVAGFLSPISREQREAVKSKEELWKTDARHRDLTINAMSLEMDGTLHDYYDGQSHLSSRKVAFIEDANQRIREDPLRILRYFRFHGQLSHDLVHEDSTLRAIEANAEGLTGVSRERIWMEMRKLLIGANVTNLLSVMYATGVAEKIGLPKLGHKGLGHTEAVCQRTQNPVTVLVSFIEDESDFVSIADHWRLSNKDVNLARYLYRWPEETISFELFSDELFLGVPRSHVLERARYQGPAELADALEAWPVPIFPLTKTDLSAAGVGKKRMGKVMTRLKSQWMITNYKQTRGELLHYLIRIV